MGRTRLERVESGGVYGIVICYSGSSGAYRYMAIHAMRYDMVCCDIEKRELEAGVWSTDLPAASHRAKLGNVYCTRW